MRQKQGSWLAVPNHQTCVWNHLRPSSPSTPQLTISMWMSPGKSSWTQPKCANLENQLRDCCFKALNSGMVCYTAEANWYILRAKKKFKLKYPSPFFLFLQFFPRSTVFWVYIFLLEERLLLSFRFSLTPFSAISRLRIWATSPSHPILTLKDLHLFLTSYLFSIRHWAVGLHIITSFVFFNFFLFFGCIGSSLLRVGFL